MTLLSRLNSQLPALPAATLLEKIPTARGKKGGGAGRGKGKAERERKEGRERGSEEGRKEGGSQSSERDE